MGVIISVSNGSTDKSSLYGSQLCIPMSGALLFYRYGNPYINTLWSKWHSIGDDVEVCTDMASYDSALVSSFNSLIVRRNRLVTIEIDFLSYFNAVSTMFCIPERFKPSYTVYGSVYCTRCTSTANGNLLSGDPALFNGQYVRLNTDGTIAQYFNSDAGICWTGHFKFAYILD